jgi:hypothetical protein
VRRFLRENSLSIFFLIIFLATLAAQSQASWRTYIDEQHAHHQPADSYSSYLASSDFTAKVMENWQSEFLQFTLYILATVWLIQKGSNESKAENDAGLESDEAQLVGTHAKSDSPRWARFGDWRTTIYSNSLVIAMTTIFLLSWASHFISGGTSTTQTNSPMAKPESAGRHICMNRASGIPPFRTGSQSFSPSARW